MPPRVKRESMMATPAQKLNDWVEYKMLVLAELERLNECVDKLQNGHNSINTDITELRRDHKEAMDAVGRNLVRIDAMQPPATETKWKLYAAVATLIATAIASLASLIITLIQSTKPGP
jgi:hypothetical protein